MRRILLSTLVAVILLPVGVMIVGSIAVRSSASSSSAPAGAEAAATATAPASKRAQLKQEAANLDASGGVGKMQLLTADIHRGTTSLTFQTPKGGLEGASTKDLDRAAGTAFAAVYGTVHYPANETVVVFKGGLVSRVTGKALPDVNTGIYTMKKSQAADVAWQDKDAVQFNIDWSYYRDFVHPAIKR